MNFFSLFRKRIKKTLKRAFFAFNTSIPIIINNKKVFIPIKAGMGLSMLKSARHEAFLSELIFDKYDENSLFVDIGTNLGQTLVKFKTQFEYAEYLGIEANPNCTSYLCSLISVNNYAHCTVITAGASDKHGVFSLLTEEQSSTSLDASATLIEGYRVSTNKKSAIKVVCLPFDQLLLEQTKKVGFIKIDIEGGEYFALIGLKKIILRDRPNIMIEVLPQTGTGREFRLNLTKKINSLISELDYTVFRIEECGENYRLQYTGKIPEDINNLADTNYLLQSK